jgi:hypothetical protein
MTPQTVSYLPPLVTPRPAAETQQHRLLSGRDAAAARRRSSRLDALLARGDRRDQAAERRDRAAEARLPAGVDAQAWRDRFLSGRDRDAAACDRAELIALLAVDDPPTG